MGIIWTDFATQNLKSIFDYYTEKANTKVAHKIRREILDSTLRLKKHPNSGQTEVNLEKLNLKHRYVVVGNYKVIYRIESESIIIIDIFDTRQNPNKMADKNRNVD